MNLTAEQYDQIERITMTEKNEYAPSPYDNLYDTLRLMPSQYGTSLKKIHMIFLGLNLDRFLELPKIA